MVLELCADGVDRRGRQTCPAIDAQKPNSIAKTLPEHSFRGHNGNRCYGHDSESKRDSVENDQYIPPRRARSQRRSVCRDHRCRLEVSKWSRDAVRVRLREVWREKRFRRRLCAVRLTRTTRNPREQNDAERSKKNPWDALTGVRFQRVSARGEYSEG